MTIPDDGLPLQAALTVEARRRLSNQIARAYRGTYGAHTGLRTLGRAIARRLIDAGWSPEMVSAALSRAVLDHPASAGGGRRNLITGEQRSVALVELARQCVTEVALDLSQSRPR